MESLDSKLEKNLWDMNLVQQGSVDIQMSKNFVIIIWGYKKKKN